MAYKEISVKFWRPEKENDSVEGTLLKVSEDVGKFKSKSYFVETVEGAQLSFFGSVLIDDRLSFCKPGDKIKIVFKGRKQSEDGKSTYNDFQVFKDDMKNGN